MTAGGEETPLAAAIDAYCACWRVMDDAARQAALARVLAPEVRYSDPMTDVTGIAALSAHIATVAAARPQAVIARTTRVDGHHDVARFGWSMKDGGVEQLAGSLDVIETAGESGLITRIIGFFGPLPA